MSTTVEKQNGSKAEALTLERAKQLFSKESFREGSELPLIRTYYREDVRFRDPIQEVSGRDALLEVTERFLKRAKELEIDLHGAAQGGSTLFLAWTMKLRFGRGPRMTIEGTSRLTLDAQGKVAEHRDYYDPWGDTIDALPGISKLYRAIMKKLG
jgi:steroid delta-isomerase